MKLIKFFLCFGVFVILESCTTSKLNNRYSQENSEDFPENYIPGNLNEALNYLNSTWSESDKEEYKNIDEDEAVAQLQMGPGMAIRNDWGLWEKKKNRLTKYFNSLGIFYPDDMSSIVLTSFHRQLNGKNINLKEQTEEYINYWKRIKDYEKEIRKRNKALAIGDTINVPFVISKSGEEVTLYILSNSSYINGFDCVIKGVITNKHNRHKDLFTIRVLDICGYEKVNIGYYKDITIGQTFQHNARLFKIIH